MAATTRVNPGSPQEKSEHDRRADTERVADSQALGTSMRNDIAKLAYALWQQRGCPDGSAEFDWCTAEEELRGAVDR